MTLETRDKLRRRIWVDNNFTIVMGSDHVNISDQDFTVSWEVTGEY